MLKLNQVIAIEKGTKARSDQELTKAHHGLQKQELLAGIARVYTPIEDGGEQYPNEDTKVQINAEEMIQQTAAILTELFDVTATKDLANCTANANIVVGDKVLVEKVPVTYLLFLEKRLVDIHTFVKKLPVLDPAFDWRFDNARSCWVTSPVKSVKNKKVMKNHVKAQATQFHPEQVEIFHEEKIIGTWETTRLSGALEAKRVRAILDRVEELQKAVKVAIQAANMQEAIPQQVGKTVFAYLFGK
eukprot:gnl/Spiro4/3869_TR1912_c0_g1_i1.p8 gnl/Spiro4/3869_TR1912_c0_g1~~gnl/Spiro4/3869_TR1912_c0_g1_i1.p8  ORF type:complete len:245 (-),score=42.56 gnl/Spiro4/3869_TR1912_c0_g1_i1:18474-19208(-)